VDGEAPKRRNIGRFNGLGLRKELRSSRSARQNYGNGRELGGWRYTVV